MAGGVVKSIDDIAELLLKSGSHADEIAKATRALHSLPGLGEALASSNANSIDDFIRRGLTSADEAVSGAFKSEGLQNALRQAAEKTRDTLRRQSQFSEAFTRAGKDADVDALSQRFGLDEDNPLVKTAREAVAQRRAGAPFKAAADNGTQNASSGAKQLSDIEVDMLRHSQTFNFQAKTYARLRQLAKNAGIFEKPLIIGAEGFRYASSSVGIVATIGTGLVGAHVLSGGKTTEGLAKASYQVAESSAEALKDISPELAKALRDMAPMMGEAMLDVMAAPVEMAEIYVSEANKRYNLGMDEKKIRMASNVLTGNFINAALESQNLAIKKEDLQRIIHEADQAPNKKKYIVEQLSRATGKTEAEITGIIDAVPSVTDTRNMNAEQAKAAVEKATASARERIGGAMDRAKQGADELKRLHDLSGDSLTAEFNKVVQEKNLSLFSSVDMFFATVADWIGNPMNIGDHFKRSVIVKETISQFGDRFGITRDREGPSLEAAPAPA